MVNAEIHTKLAINYDSNVLTKGLKYFVFDENEEEDYS